MMSTKALGMGPALRRAAFNPRLAVRNQIVLRNAFGKRAIQTESLPPSASEKILNKQRLNRPSSPHFTIYQPQLTWIASIANRVTGGGLSALLYGFSIAYLLAPGTFDSAHVVEFVHGLPESVKYAGKFILALPFTFHSFNGLRHLAWDAVKFANVKGVYVTGYAVLGATAVSTAILTLTK
ncbi:SDHC, cytochrome b subunit of succinate dehydrogenase [Macrolepiota fuliginosa MF-IS2]|uniref:SDHC, cytochrome b subunit of succinate dehydrogenase n=1 Tax=Macrolepiota fuliginosa MF-IS2 TaxID=1400762 RepID=A0A9P5XCJ6_9AGAR|nr:SDHC, cytochrome b subunit of succinate dehydrogenase [Macrolepiota fuliginosa MF-IS2]